MQRAIKSNISDRAFELLGPDPRYPEFYALLRRVNDRRQEQIAQLMFMSADYTVSFLRLLIAASKHSDYIKEKRPPRGISQRELAAIERTIQPLEEEFRRSAASYSDDAWAVAVTSAYVRKLLRNDRIASYLSAVYPKIFDELSAIGHSSSRLKAE
jgi:hypothetical protein